MSGIAGSEFFLIIIIGLIVLGPKRLPQVANQLGSWLGQARRMTRMMKRQLEDEINLDLDKINKPIDIEKGLGLKDEPKPAPAVKKDADVSRPEYVHEPDFTERNLDDTPQDEPPELPDDYSPAHGPDELGTGVGDKSDDDDYISDDELDPVVATNDEAEVEDSVDVNDDVAEPPQKETA